MRALTPRSILWINRNFRLILVAIAVVALAAGYFTVLASNVQRVFRTELATVDQLEQQRNEEQLKFDRIQQFVNRYNAVSSEEIARLERILPKQDDIPLLYDQVPALVSAAGLTLDSVGISNGAGVAITGSPTLDGQPHTVTVAGRTLSSVDVALSISGGKTYTDLQRFLDAVERNLRVFDITSIAFPTQVPEGQASVVIPGYSVNLRTYYFTN